ncbi:MAG: hypothetical protein DRN66_00410 [Candidatus Nanohalarchaeota archaeon]|nr:MAG: hypothetical protein DRN66_00410 [Candidatus Nanohaloarchaeota archaeon]
MIDILDEKMQKKIKIATLTLCFFFIGGGILIYFLDINRKASAFFFMIGVLFAIIPSAILDYFKFREQQELEEEFPVFIKNFAEIKKSGMSFPQAFEQISHTDIGPLTPYVQKTASQISWGIPFSRAIKNLSNSVKSKIIKQSFIIISEAFQMGGNIVEVMRDLSKNIYSIKEINERRGASISQQIIIMYFIFFIFLATLIGIYKLLIPMLSIDINMSGGVGGMVSGGSIDIGKKEMPDFCDVPPIAPLLCTFGSVLGFDKDIRIKEYEPPDIFGTREDKGIETEPSQEGTKKSYLYFKSLFFLMCLVQATCTGVIAGVLKRGKAIAGVSHMAVMYVSTIVVFILFV